MVNNVIGSTSLAITDPLVQLWLKFVEIFPQIIGALIVLLVGYVAAYMIGNLLKVVLTRAGLDKYMDKAQVTASIGRMRLSAILSDIVKWFIFIIFLQSAVNLVNLGPLTLILSQFVNWLPDVIVAIVILIFGLVIAHIVQIKMEEHSNVRGTRFFSKLLYFLIVLVVALMALEQIGVNISLVKNSFLLLVAGAALAIGLSFGLGTKNEASNAMKTIRKFF